MTILSMTGFGAATVVTPMGLVSAEVRTVNSRFFELHTRIPEELRSIIDPWIRERILVDLPRGKVEVRLSLTKTELHLVASALNKTSLRSKQAVVFSPGRCLNCFGGPAF